MKNKVYPANFYIIEENHIDIEKWLDDFEWPLSNNLNGSISMDLEKGYLDVVNSNSKGFIGDVLLVAHRIHRFYSLMLFNIKYVQEIKKINNNIICSNIEKVLYGLLNNSLPNYPDFLSSLTLFSSLMKPFSPFNTKLRSINLKRKEIYFNIKNKKYYCNNQLPMYMYPLEGTLERKYTKTINNYINFFDLRKLLPRYRLRNIQFNNQFQRVTNLLMQQIDKIAKKYDIHIEDQIFSYMKKITITYLSILSVMHNSFLKVIKNSDPFHLILHQGGFPEFRSLSVAVRENKGKVTICLHDHTSIPIIRYFWPSFDMSTTDEYIVNTNSAKKHMEFLKIKHPPARNNSPIIKSENSDYFWHFWQKQKLIPPPKKIKRVMLVDITLRSDNIPRFTTMDLVFVDFLLRTIKLLNKNGFEVLYKRHPDILKYRKWNDTVFDNYCKTSFIRFEEIMDETDAYIFFSASSSVFPYAICTNKPIIFIKSGLQPFFDDAKESLLKRCSFINAFFDQRNRMQINTDEFINTLNKKPTYSDTDFMEKHLFPS